MSPKNPTNGIQLYIPLCLVVGLTRPYIGGIVFPALATVGLSYSSMAFYFACGSRGPILERSLCGVYSLNMVLILSCLFYMAGFVSKSSEELLERYTRHFAQKTPHRKWIESPTTMMAYYRRMRIKSLSPI